MPSGISVGGCGEKRKGSDAWEARKANQAVGRTLLGGPKEYRKGEAAIQGVRRQLRVRSQAQAWGEHWAGIGLQPSWSGMSLSLSREPGG